MLGELNQKTIWTHFLYMATWFVYFFLNCSWQTIFFSRKLSIYSNFLMYWYKVYNLVISAVSVVISLLYIMLVAQSCPTLRPHGLSMEFSRQEYWSGLPFPSPGDHPSNLGFLHCRQILYCLNYQGSPFAHYFIGLLKDPALFCGPYCVSVVYFFNFCSSLSSTFFGFTLTAF